jgi:hypothetical protein
MFSLQDFQSLFMAGRATAGECQQNVQQKTGFCATSQEFALSSG